MRTTGARARAAWRATGADLPFGDPRGHHGVPMEGYYWRVSDPAGGRVVVALCGVLGTGRARRALVALASHPGGAVRVARVAGVEADPRRLGLLAGGLLRVEPGLLELDLGPDARLSVRLTRRREWPRRPFGGLGPAGALPRLGQYWHPHLLGAEAAADAVTGTQALTLPGADAYAEKNWGRSFPPRWWWGQAQGFGDDACVAFAGGTPLGRHGPSATSLVLRLGDRLLRLVAPSALVRAETGGGRWRVRARAAARRLPGGRGGGAGARAARAARPPGAGRGRGGPAPRRPARGGGAPARAARLARRVAPRGPRGGHVGARGAGRARHHAGVTPPAALLATR